MRLKNTQIFIMAMILSLTLVSCEQKNNQKSFKESHDEFETKLVNLYTDNDDIPFPPEGVFDLVDYPSKSGNLAAYVSCNPHDGKKHPLIIWVAGGWENGIDESPWSDAQWDNDQSASAFWKNGVLTLYPSFRGACGNPGNYETFFGEIDDIDAACKYAQSLPYVDPDRIYLGGHSTGGTRALLAAEYTDSFRAVFCFGPVDKIKLYDPSEFTFDTSNNEEYIMRSPIYWLNDVKIPTFIIEGSDGNSDCVKRIRNKSGNKNINCYIVNEADHFSVLAPVTNLLAEKILNDTGDKTNISITHKELQNAMKQKPNNIE